MRITRNKDSNMSIKPKKNLSLSIGIGLLIAILSVAIFFGLKTAFETEDYYVLSQDISSKTQITETMLTKVTTSKGTAPQNAISIQQIRQGTIFSKIPLKSGDVISSSNTGLNVDTNNGIPDDWVITSFTIDPKLSVNGLIKKGDYFDILGVSVEEGSKYLFHNVLALGVQVEGQMYKDATDAVTSGEVEEGMITYIVGMPAEDAAKLHYALAKYEIIKTVLAPASLTYKYRDVSNLVEPFFMDAETVPSDLFEGTDSTFTPVLRDNNGRPVNRTNCEAGKIVPEELCDRLEELESNKEEKIVPRDNDPNAENEDLNNDDNKGENINDEEQQTDDKKDNEDDGKQSSLFKKTKSNKTNEDENKQKENEENIENSLEDQNVNEEKTKNNN